MSEKYNIKLTEEQKKEWAAWLAERPENIKKVAKNIVPWKRYKLSDTKEDEDVGNRYIPTSYSENKDGEVTITCQKVNDTFSFLGGYGVFGFKEEDLIEDKDY